MSSCATQWVIVQRIHSERVGMLMTLRTPHLNQTVFQVDENFTDMVCYICERATQDKYLDLVRSSNEKTASVFSLLIILQSCSMSLPLYYVMVFASRVLSYQTAGCSFTDKQSRADGLRSAFLLRKVTPANVQPIRMWSDKSISTNQSTSKPTRGVSPLIYCLFYQTGYIFLSQFCHLVQAVSGCQYLITTNMYHNPF